MVSVINSAEEDAGKLRRLVEHGTLSAHGAKERRPADLGGGGAGEGEQGGDRQGVFGDAAGILGTPGTERAGDARCDARADPARDDGHHDQRDREHERDGGDGVVAQAADEIGVQDVRDRRHQHDRRSRRRQRNDGAQRVLREQVERSMARPGPVADGD
jgi:hypothetical protein